MNKLLIALFLGSFSQLSIVQAQENKKVQEVILSIMNEQEKAWSEGNVDGFMQGYWNSDSLLFIGSAGPQYGWLPTLNRYKQAYPNKQAMGQLTFELISFKYLSPSNAHLSGKWHLKREEGDLSGYYSLLWEKKNGKWKIIYDHSSSSKNK